MMVIMLSLLVVCGKPILGVLQYIGVLQVGNINLNIVMVLLNRKLSLRVSWRCEITGPIKLKFVNALVMLVECMFLSQNL